jgi:hypothetical protein
MRIRDLRCGGMPGFSLGSGIATARYGYYEYDNEHWDFMKGRQLIQYVAITNSTRPIMHGAIF